MVYLNKTHLQAYFGVEPKNEGDDVRLLSQRSKLMGGGVNSTDAKVIKADEDTFTAEFQVDVPRQAKFEQGTGKQISENPGYKAVD